MAPARQPAQPFTKDEKVLCFHGEMLYEAKILDIQPADSGEGFQYRIHYKGWKNTWDDWVSIDRIRKFTEENKELASTLHAQMKDLRQKSSAKAPKKGLRINGTDSTRGSEERTAGAAASGRGPRRARDFDLEQEDGFHARPSIKLPIPDHIKAMLVDDWENITKNNQLVPLPHPHPVDDILNDYLNYERPNREDGSANMDILEEVVAGLREYFEKSLSRILLYRFERPQYHEIRKVWEKATENDKHKSVCDTYGPEHLCRLMVSLPELVAQTNMDQQSVSRLREELSKLTVWLGKNAKTYFVSEYETPSQEYIDKARSF
ncbi:chromatin modification-related protein eaf3 [Colletotrichum spaethianum]|uniref:Chromatin modification-related protein EAF3 n=1 Tax=Colletotrichum spaethianum TaxID=700344 RepID=A0AA37L9N8_9PEZI|nr:chromatin modification-related protein eaf3 [Colletotrichum spaethianum]GKT44398.1 chromatin modification-related protein eaf3 [Colletotrichum spaethianum]